MDDETLSILLDNGVRVDVPAVRVGLFGVHEAQRAGYFVDVLSARAVYSITHVKTGKAIPRTFANKRTAIRIARLLSRDENWDFETMDQFTERRDALRESFLRAEAVTEKAKP